MGLLFLIHRPFSIPCSYIFKVLAIGTDFDKSVADAYLLSLWGGSGTGDLTAFATTIPVVMWQRQRMRKIIPGTMAVV